MIDLGGSSEFKGSWFIAVFPDTEDWGDNWKNITCSLEGSSSWSVTSVKAARLPFRESNTTDKDWRYVVIGQIPAGATGSWKVRVSYGGVSKDTVADAGAASPDPSGTSLTWASGTLSHSPTAGPGPGLFWLLGIWDGGAGMHKLGWRPVPGASASTAESDTLFRPTGMSGSPWKAAVVEVCNVNSTDTAKDCHVLRLATNIN